MLALYSNTRSLLWAVVDPWEIRGTGRLRPRPRSRTLALRLLIRREKATVLVALGQHLPEVLQKAAGRQGPGVVIHIPRLPPSAIARDLYPELPMYAPTPALEIVTRLAIAVVLHSPVPTRPYAPRRHRAAHGAPRSSSARP